MSVHRALQRATWVRPVAACLTSMVLAVLWSTPSAFAINTMGRGGGWFDCNNDSYLDLCYLSPQGLIVLMIYNPAQGKFNDHSSTAFPGGIQEAQDGLGVACGDLNNDGLSDLFLTFNGVNHLLLNNGDNTFSTIGRSVGIVPGRDGEVMSASAAIFDYDQDGLLDIFVANYEGMGNQFFHNQGIDQEGRPHFIDRAPEFGMEYATGGKSDWSLGAAVFDYDNDGDLDLYVANDYDGINDTDPVLNPGRNILYRNDQVEVSPGTWEHRLVDATEQSNSGDPGWAMGVAFGDYNNDGWQDIYVTNFWEDALLHNNQDGTFTNVTKQVGLPGDTPTTPESAPCRVCNGWGTQFIDFDNDGDLDIHVVNGFISNGFGQLTNEPNELWENMSVNNEVTESGEEGDQSGLPQFTLVAAQTGIDDIGDGRGAAYGDFNRDGFVDIAVFNNNFAQNHEGGALPPQELLYVNQGNGTFRDMAQSLGIRTEHNDGPLMPSRGDFGGNGWLEVEARGTTSNRSAFGTRVTIRAGDRVWVKELGTGSYCSTSSSLLHFGLGSSQMVDRMTVRFPGGKTVDKINIPANQIITIHEDDLTPVKLLSFHAESSPEGARVSWSHSDDTGLSGFVLARRESNRTVTVAPFVTSRQGRGEVLDPDVPAGEPVTYLLDAIYRDGARQRIGSAEYRHTLPRPVVLGQNFPNPFTASTVIPIAGAPGGSVEVRIFDTGGRLVQSLRALTSEGGGILSWDGRDQAGRQVPGGTYFYKLAGETRALKMIRKR